MLRDELVDEAHADGHFPARHRGALRGAGLREAHDVRTKPLQIVERAVLTVQRDERGEDRIAGAARHGIRQLDLVPILGLHKVGPATRRGELFLGEERRIGAEAENDPVDRDGAVGGGRGLSLRPRVELGQPRRPIGSEQALGRALQERIERAAVPDVGFRIVALGPKLHEYFPRGLAHHGDGDSGVAREGLRSELAGIGIVRAVDRERGRRRIHRDEGEHGRGQAREPVARRPAAQRSHEVQAVPVPRRAASTSAARSVAASLSSTPLTNLCPSVPP